MRALIKSCILSDCTEKHYAKGYCRNHYNKFKRTNNPYGLIKECKAFGCSNMTFSGLYCRYHNLRLREGWLLIASNRKGVNNCNWNGGVSDYKDHSLMKRQRKIKLKQTKGKCEICQGEGKQIHHIDGTKDNHKLGNLIFVCYKCHGVLHIGRKKKKKKGKACILYYNMLC